MAAEGLRVVPERDLRGHRGVRYVDGGHAGAGVALVAEEHRLAVLAERDCAVPRHWQRRLVVGEMRELGGIADVEEVEALLPLVGLACVDADGQEVARQVHGVRPNHNLGRPAEPSQVVVGDEAGVLREAVLRRVAVVVTVRLTLLGDGVGRRRVALHVGVRARGRRWAFVGGGRAADQQGEGHRREDR